jgi:hypothetical protein
MASRTNNLVKFSLTVLLLLQLILLQAMAASPSLHDDCHHHHDDEPKTCVIDLMLHGGYGSHIPSAIPVGVSPASEISISIASVPKRIIPSNLLGERLLSAPPRGP